MAAILAREGDEVPERVNVVVDGKDGDRFAILSLRSLVDIGLSVYIWRWRLG